MISLSFTLARCQGNNARPAVGQMNMRANSLSLPYSLGDVGELILAWPSVKLDLQAHRHQLTGLELLCPPTLFPTPPQFDWAESLLRGRATATHSLQPCRPVPGLFEYRSLGLDVANFSPHPQQSNLLHPAKHVNTQAGPDMHTNINQQLPPTEARLSYLAIYKGQQLF